MGAMTADGWVDGSEGKGWMGPRTGDGWDRGQWMERGQGMYGWE